MRSYLVLLVVLGVVSSLLSHVPSGSSHTTDKLYVNASANSDENSSTNMNSEPQPMDGSIELQRERDGHFYADVEINGVLVHMLVDTGASGIALSRDDARKAGLATSIAMNDVVGEGADASIHGEYVTIDRVALGQKTVERMPAIILNDGEQSLLGQSFLKQFSSVDIHGDTMTFR